MTRSAFYDARLAHWKDRFGEHRSLDSEAQALWDVEAAQAAGVEWTPEAPPLPHVLSLYEANPALPARIIEDDKGLGGGWFVAEAVTLDAKNHVHPGKVWHWVSLKYGA